MATDYDDADSARLDPHGAPPEHAARAALITAYLQQAAEPYPTEPDAAEGAVDHSAVRASVGLADQFEFWEFPPEIDAESPFPEDSLRGVMDRWFTEAAEAPPPAGTDQGIEEAWDRIGEADEEGLAQAMCDYLLACSESRHRYLSIYGTAALWRILALSDGEDLVAADGMTTGFATANRLVQAWHDRLTAAAAQEPGGGTDIARWVASALIGPAASAIIPLGLQWTPHKPRLSPVSDIVLVHGTMLIPGLNRLTRGDKWWRSRGDLAMHLSRHVTSTAKRSADVTAMEWSGAYNRSHREMAAQYLRAGTETRRAAPRWLIGHSYGADVLARAGHTCIDTTATDRGIVLLAHPFTQAVADLTRSGIPVYSARMSVDPVLAMDAQIQGPARRSGGGVTFTESVVARTTVSVPDGLCRPWKAHGYLRTPTGWTNYDLSTKFGVR